MTDFSEHPDLASLSEQELAAEAQRVEALLGQDDRTDSVRRRTIGGYLMRVNEELGRRRGERSGNGSAAVS
jgi:hypothetical protein